MEENNKRNKNTKALIVIMLLTVVTMITGAAFVYASTVIVGNENSSSIIFESQTIQISYDAGKIIETTAALPGWSDNKTFTVKNTGNVVLFYNVDWVQVTNDFSYKDDLTYVLERVDNSTNVKSGTCPSGNLNFVNNVRIDVNETHTYRLTVSFANRGVDQSENSGKTFASKIEVSAVE